MYIFLSCVVILFSCNMCTFVYIGERKRTSTLHFKSLLGISAYARQHEICRKNNMNWDTKHELIEERSQRSVLKDQKERGNTDQETYTRPTFSLGLSIFQPNERNSISESYANSVCICWLPAAGCFQGNLAQMANEGVVPGEGRLI